MAPKPKPVVGRVPEQSAPVRGDVPPRGKAPNIGVAPAQRRIAFSFRFWGQIDYFGLDGVSAKWFVSLLQKLQELSKYRVEDFLTVGETRHQWRYHEIDWTAEAVPIRHDNCAWIGADYMNDVEYPFMQFQVSTALGRVVGFWDEEKAFNIVLLDPMHNIQPSRKHNYTVRECYPAHGEYANLLARLDRLQSATCGSAECGASAAIAQLGSSVVNSVVVVGLDDADIGNINAIREEWETVSMSDIFKRGVDAAIAKILDEPPTVDDGSRDS